MHRLRFAIPLLAFGLLSSGFLMGQGKKAEKEPLLVTKRLPNNYSKLGLSAKQKNEIYKIQAKYAVEVDKLKQQLEALREQQKLDVENVLTVAQKTRLREIRGGEGNRDEANPDRDIKEKAAKIKKK